MNKKGLTTVELIVSFTLTMAIVVFLVQIIVNLTRIYGNNGIKTEILNKQAIISDTINTSFLEKRLVSIESCGDNCYDFHYENGESDNLKIRDNILTFGKLTTNINNTTFGDIKLDVIYTPTLQNNVNDGIFMLVIPINSEIDYNFDIKVVYQFNTVSSLIDDFFTP